jgi:hypothetical protein
METQIQEQQPARLGAVLLRVAWLAILLGLVIEIVLLLIAAGYGRFRSLKPFAADLAQKISWSEIVCLGLAVGSTAAKSRGLLMGLLGLVSAPAAFFIARAVHKGAMQVVAISGDAAAGPSPVLVAIIKGLEYGFLGFALHWIQQRPWGGASAHAGLGLLAGMVFGGAILGLIIQAAPGPLPPAVLVSRAANEFIFPVGCAVVIYVSDIIGKRMAR